MRRVVVTGVGVVTGLGTGLDATWKALLEGRSAVGPITNFDASSLRTRLAAEATDFAPEDFVDRRSLRKMTRGDQLAVAGAQLAWADAGLGPEDADPARTGLYTGSSKEVSDLVKLIDGVLAATDDDGRFDAARAGEMISTFNPLYYVEGLQAASLFYVSKPYGLMGANTYFAGTAEAGAAAIGTAYRTIRRGEADRAIAGGFDDPVWWWSMSSFDSLGVLTPHNELGASAFRPYDRQATGAVLGEGAAFLVLEDHDTARSRGAPVYAEVVGYGNAADAHQALTPHPDGRGLVNALRAVLREAGTSPDEVPYLASHGSGTILGDRSEARALRTVFGPAADRLMASSVKPATGHLVGGAGALNAAVAAMAIRTGSVPPTLNHEDPAPGCELDWVPREAREVPVDQAVAIARGLEGQNVALAFRRMTDAD